MAHEKLAMDRVRLRIGHASMAAAEPLDDLREGVIEPFGLLRAEPLALDILALKVRVMLAHQPPPGAAHLLEVCAVRHPEIGIAARNHRIGLRDRRPRPSLPPL